MAHTAIGPPPSTKVTMTMITAMILKLIVPPFDSDIDVHITISCKTIVFVSCLTGF